MIVVSGIQPSGRLHLGNYFGAIEKQIALQEGNECYYFIANYHALTSVKDGQKLRDFTYEIAATYLALGLDKANLFKQSDVPEVTELAWILSNLVNIGVMNRNHAFKEKSEKGISSSVGLYTYPVLMSADILIYGAEIVPVGEDQIQHIEIARDLCDSFNREYKTDIFTKPEYSLALMSKIPGIDGQKMSKSYNNTIPIFTEPKELKKLISSIVTTSVDYTKEPMPVNKDTIFTLYALMANPKERQELKINYEQNREFGYGHAKELLIQRISDIFGPVKRDYDQLLKDKGKLDSVLKKGANAARQKAQETMTKVKEVCGL